MIRKRRERTLLAFLVLAALALGGIAVDAKARRRATEVDRMARVAETTGLSDLALSSSSRWLRHPSLAEPGAATWDAPLGLDVDPAGMTIPGLP